jgi:hypothetical protein
VLQAFKTMRKCGLILKNALIYLPQRLFRTGQSVGLWFAVDGEGGTGCKPKALEIKLRGATKYKRDIAHLHHVTTQTFRHV